MGLIAQLRGDEKLLPVDAALLYGFAHAVLVPVHFGGIDVAVARLDGGFHR